MSVDSTLFWSGDFSTVDISERRAPLVTLRILLLFLAEIACLIVYSLGLRFKL